MPRVKDYEYPYITVAETSAPATPSSGIQKLFVDPVDHLLKLKDSGGFVTPVGNGSPLTTKGDLWGFDTGDARIPVGVTNGHVLTVDSAQALGVKWAAAGGGGAGALTLLETHAASGSATLDFTAWKDDSLYDRYFIDMCDIVPVASSDNLFLRFSTDGGATWDSSNLYAWAQVVTRAGDFGHTGSEHGSLTDHIALSWPCCPDWINNGANFNFNGEFWLYKPGGAHYKRLAGTTNHMDGSPFWLLNMLQGAYESTTAIDGLRFYMSSGNIASGDIRIYGLAKA